jgi:2,3,4,5-tetrahydropyridine-2-carboxylate N-succinyltransferase
MFSIGIGIGTKNANDDWLEVFYPRPLLQPSPDLIESFGQIVDFSASEGLFPLDEAARAALCTCIEQPEQLALLKALQNSQKPCVLTWLKTDGPITSTPAAYLKLHLLSHGLTRPNSLNLDGIYAALPNIAWTSEGPMAISALPDAMLLARVEGRHLEVTSLDKFPKLTNYVVPDGRANRRFGKSPSGRLSRCGHDRHARGFC